MILLTNLIGCALLFLFADRFLAGKRDPLLPEAPSGWKPEIVAAGAMAALYTGILLVGTIAFDNFEGEVLPASGRGRALYMLPPIGVLLMLMAEHGLIPRVSSLQNKLVALVMVVLPFLRVCYRLMAAGSQNP